MEQELVKATVEVGTVSIETALVAPDALDEKIKAIFQKELNIKVSVQADSGELLNETTQSSLPLYSMLVTKNKRIQTIKHKKIAQEKAKIEKTLEEERKKLAELESQLGRANRCSWLPGDSLKRKQPPHGSSPDPQPAKRPVKTYTKASRRKNTKSDEDFEADASSESSESIEEDPAYEQFKKTYEPLYKRIIDEIIPTLEKLNSTAVYRMLIDSDFSKKVIQDYLKPCCRFGPPNSASKITGRVPDMVDTVLERFPTDDPEALVTFDTCKPQSGVCDACGLTRTLTRTVDDDTVDDGAEYCVGSDCFYKIEAMINWLGTMRILGQLISIDEIDIVQREAVFEELYESIIYMQTVVDAIEKKYDEGKTKDLRLEPPERKHLTYEDDEVVGGSTSKNDADSFFPDLEDSHSGP